ncbi:MAG: SusC/RagA family TonB-linked outer membrane protein [Sphingobacteriales bacterium]|nr:MAG: SusC/RagA family TonB-linked outer membrane protein [Sphingobacteriales bacterium]
MAITNMKYKLKFLVVILAAGVAVTTACAQQNKSGGVAAKEHQSKTTLTGVIKDAATGKPLAGIRVAVVNFSAAITDDNGTFKLTVPSYLTDINITGDGYASRQVSLKGRTDISIALLDDEASSFMQSVSMPFQKIAQRNVAAAIGNYSANGEWKRPDETIDGLLQGQVAGLNSIRRSGAPGTGANLFLRGYNSLFGTNKPLIVVDGMIYDVNDYGESIIANNYTNPLALLNTQDIDNVTVLKDAASIYGTKGANGAILITTSKAKQQATKIDFGIHTGFNQAPATLSVMNATDYRTYLAEMLQSKGMTASEIAAQPYMNDDVTSAEYFRYHNTTDWQKKVLNQGMNNNYFLKVTGGDNIATYALSLGYMKNEGVIKNTDLKRYNTRFNADFNFSKRFTGTANLSFTYNEQNLKDQGLAYKTAPLFTALIKAPFFTDHEVNEKGVRSPNLEDVDILGISNPAALIETMQAFNKFYRFNGSFAFKYDISKHFSAHTLFGIVYDKVRENIFVPRKGVANDTLSNEVADSRLGTQVKRLFSVFTDSRIQYARVWNSKHSIAARLGLRYQHNRAEQDFALGFNSATDELLSVQNGVNALRQIGGGIGEWNWMNTYANVEYGYKEKFFVSLNAAMDGSSRFGKQVTNGIAISGNNYAVLPSASVAWLVSSEKFMAKSFLNLLKLRASISKTGNDDIGNYTSRQAYASQNFLGMQGLVRNGVPNPAIQWETNQKINAGIDIATWNERLGLSVDVYKNKTTNMLVYEELASVTGFNNILTNNGALQNTGVELSLNLRVVNTRYFKWDVAANIGTYKNKITSVPGGSFTTNFAGATLLTRQGDPANLFYGYVAKGVFSTTAEAANAGLQKRNADGSFSSFMAGDMHFDDLNGDKIIDELDRQVIGNPNPDFYGGFNSRVSYKNIELNVLFTFSKGNDVFNHLRYRLEAGSGIENQLNSIRNRWRAEGQVTSTPKIAYADPMGNGRFSSRWMEDGSYLRMRTLSVVYHIPLKSEGFIKNASVYMGGNNLLTFTKYLGYDPEFSASPSVFAQGIDAGLDPLYKTITIGAKIGF